MKKLIPFPLTDEDRRLQITIPFGGTMTCTVCTVCGEAISEARLRAILDAKTCVTCAAKNDVPRIKRFDDHTENGEATETYYTKNHAIEAEVERLRVFNPYFVSKDGHYIRGAGKVEINHQEPSDAAEEIDQYEISPVDTPAHQLTMTLTLESAVSLKQEPQHVGD